VPTVKPGRNVQGMRAALRRKTAPRTAIAHPKRKRPVVGRVAKPRARKGKPRLIPPRPKKLPGLTDIRSYQDLQSAASGEVDSELSGQISPLETQRAQTLARQTAAHNEEEAMFNQLQPYVSASAKLVSDSYDKTNAAEQAIFAAAGARLNALKQNTASEAQALAQKIGGPVAVDAFTAPVDESIGAAGAEHAGQLLHDMGLAQAGVQHAATFAGQVFPLVRSSKEAATRAGYEETIKGLEDHIAQLKGTRTGAINARLNDLQKSEREYQLQKAQQQLEKLKVHQDWQATIHTLKNDDKRLKLAGGQFGLQEAGVTGKYKGKPTLDAKTTAAKIKQLTQSQRLDAQKLGLSKLEYVRKLNQTQEGLEIQRARVRVQQQKNSMQMIDALLNPGSNKPMTITRKHFIPKNSPEATAAQVGAITGKRKDLHWDAKRKQWYYYNKETMSSAEWAQTNTGGTPIRDAKQIYNFLLNQGISPKLARVLVKRRTGRDPVPGKKKKAPKAAPAGNYGGVGGR